MLEERRRLNVRINALEKKADMFMVLDDAVKWANDKGKRRDGDDESSGDEWNDEDGEDDALLPEEAKLPLPSSLAIGEAERLGLDEFANQEARLRKGQINDALDGLRLSLGEKSLLLRTEVRNARSQRTGLKAWDSVNKQDSNARRHKKIYDEARNALKCLGTEERYLETLQDITADDMKMPGDITEENRVGQRSDTLAWFWRFADDPDHGNTLENDRLKECKYLSFGISVLFHGYSPRQSIASTG